MTHYDDETLMRRIDGELSPDEGTAIDTAAASDPALAARLDAMRGLRSLARDAFPIGPDARDQDLARLIAASSQPRPSPLASVGAWFKDAFAPQRAPAWGALAAAAFVAGVVIAPQLSRDAPALINDAGQIGDPALVRVLDQRLASQGPDASGRAIGLTFQDASGRWCRSFNDAKARLGGLACRQDDAWAVQVMAPLAAAQGDIRTASSDTPAPVLAAIDTALAGDVVDASAEAEARDGGWR